MPTPSNPWALWDSQQGIMVFLAGNDRPGHCHSGQSVATSRNMSEVYFHHFSSTFIFTEKKRIIKRTH